MSGESGYTRVLASMPNEWERVRVDSLGSLIGGGTPSRAVAANWNGTIPWVTPTEITSSSGKVLRATRETITEQGLASSSARILPPDTVLITTRATIGAVAIAGMPVATNQGFRSLVCNETAHPDFYYHFFAWLAPELRRLAIGSTFDELSRNDFSAVSVPRPPLEEQMAIAEILDRFDRAIATRRAASTKLEYVLLGLRDARLNAAFDEADRSEGATTLGALVDAPHAGTWGTAPKTAGNIRCIRAADFDRRTFRSRPDGAPWRHVPEAELASQLLRAGDLIIEKSGGGPDQPVGFVVLHEDGAPAVCSNFAARLRPQPGHDPRYLAYLFAQAYRRGVTVAAAQQTTGIQNLNTRFFLSTPVVVPDIDSQGAIAGEIDTALTAIAAEAAAIRKLLMMKEGALADLLSGRRRVNAFQRSAAA